MTLLPHLIKTRSDQKAIKRRREEETPFALLTLLEKLLFREDEQLMKILFELSISKQFEEKYGELARWTLNLFVREGQQMRLLEFGIKHHLTNQLLISNELTCDQYLSTNYFINHLCGYFLVKEASDYCRSLLSPSIQLLCMTSLSFYEIQQPAQFSPTSSSASSSSFSLSSSFSQIQLTSNVCNVALVKEWILAFVDVLVEFLSSSQSNLLPPDVCLIFRIFGTLLDSKSPKLKSTVLSNLYFVRMLIPFILLPEKFDVIDAKHVTSTKRKSLLCFATILEAVGCGKKFPPDHFLFSLNETVVTQHARLVPLLDSLSTSAPDEQIVETEEPFATKEELSSSLSQFARWMELVVESNQLPSNTPPNLSEEIKKSVKEFLQTRKTSLSNSGRSNSGNSSPVPGQQSSQTTFSSRLVHQKELALLLLRQQMDKTKMEKASLESMLAKMQKEKESNTSVLEQCQEQIKTTANELEKLNVRQTELLGELDRAQQVASVEREFKQLKQQIKRMNEEKQNIESQLHLLKQEQSTNDVKSTISSLEQLQRTTADTIQKISLRLIQINSEIEKQKQQQLQSSPKRT